MFTGIVECIGQVEFIKQEGSNILMEISSSISNDLKIDQSLSHNGVCLTIIKKDANTHQVQLIQESIQRSNFKFVKVGDYINLERAMKLGDRLDGHMVQGHVDTCVEVLNIEDKNGSHLFQFSLDEKDAKLIIPKGSICVNGVSLTVIDVGQDYFSVGIIPYTMQHTHFKYLQKADKVNLEFDMIGKYMLRMIEHNQKRFSDLE